MHFIVSVSRAVRGEVSTQRLIAMGLTVGTGFNREGGVRIDASHCYLITIGDDVTLAPNVHILAHDASLKNHLGVVRISGVKIGNRVFIGAGTIIMPGVEIADRVIVGAGSVVTRKLDTPGVYVGNPARLIMDIDEFLEKQLRNLSDRPVLAASHFSNISQSDTRRFLHDTVGCAPAYQVSRDLDRLDISKNIIEHVQAHET